MDVSHDMDMATLYVSSAVDAEMEADMIRGIMETNGIPSIVMRGAEFPSFGYGVQVPQARLEEAQRLVAEAQAAGPEAASEAERESEQGRG